MAHRSFAGSPRTAAHTGPAHRVGAAATRADCSGGSPSCQQEYRGSHRGLARASFEARQTGSNRMAPLMSQNCPHPDAHPSSSRLTFTPMYRAHSACKTSGPAQRPLRVDFGLSGHRSGRTITGYSVLTRGPPSPARCAKTSVGGYGQPSATKSWLWATVGAGGFPNRANRRKFVRQSPEV
jgi:hypothetical protein